MRTDVFIYSHSNVNARVRLLEHLEKKKKSMCAGETHSYLAELHLNLLGDHLSPVRFTQEVPEEPSHGCVHPGNAVVLLLLLLLARLHLSCGGALELESRANKLKTKKET